MQKEVVKDQVRKEGSPWGYIRTVECECGRVATFETWRWDCVECGNRYYLFSNNVRHLTKRALDGGWTCAFCGLHNHASARRRCCWCKTRRQ